MLGGRFSIWGRFSTSGMVQYLGEGLVLEGKFSTRGESLVLGGKFSPCGESLVLGWKVLKLRESSVLGGIYVVGGREERGIFWPERRFGLRGGLA